MREVLFLLLLPLALGLQVIVEGGDLSPQEVEQVVRALEENRVPEGYSVEVLGDVIIVRRLSVEEEKPLWGQNVYKEGNRFRVELVLRGPPGLYLVEVNVPKGYGWEAKGRYVVFDFDPVIGWVVRLEGERRLTYYLESRPPQELTPSFVALQACDVSLRFLRLEPGPITRGEFQVLFEGRPVYTPELQMEGNVVFLRETMSYVFETRGKDIHIRAWVGDCPLDYKKKVSSPSPLPFLVLLVLLLLYFLLRR